MIIDNTNRLNPSPGLPNPNKPNRNTQAKMLMIITFLIPNLLRKNGMVRMNNVSEICEVHRSKFRCLYPNEAVEVSLIFYNNDTPIAGIKRIATANAVEKKK